MIKVKKRVHFDPRRHRKSGATKHIVFGEELRSVPAYLEIIAFDEDPLGFYLIHYDSEGNELTDTYHDSVDLAMEQAEREYLICKEDWSNVN